MDQKEEKKLKKEIAKLNRIFKNIGEDKKKLCENLIKNAAFMAITLEELQNDINENGPIGTYINGNGFKVSQETPAQKSYNAMINRYTAVIKTLVDLLPDDKTETANKAGEALAAFIAKGKPSSSK